MSEIPEKIKQKILNDFENNPEFTCPDCEFKFIKYSTIEILPDSELGYWIRAVCLCKCGFEMVDTFDIEGKQ